MENSFIKKLLNAIVKIISYIALAILFLVAIFLVYYIVSSSIAKKRNERPPISLYTIVSPSMEPNIKVYDVIVEFRVKDESTLKKGQIITFYSSSLDTGGYTVTHRIKEIVKKDGEIRYITKGDNNQSVDDGYITFKDIVGRVKFKLSGLGRLQFFVSSSLGWVFIILIPAIGIILFDIYRIIKILKIKNQLESIPTMADIENVRKIARRKDIMAKIEKNRKQKRGQNGK